jgi:hypothetical protein
MSLRFPALEQFLGNNFHQDFGLDFDDAETALRHGLEIEPRQNFPAILDEIEAILSEETDESAVGKILLSLGCYYHTYADGHTPITWLRRIKAGLEEAKGDHLTPVPSPASTDESGPKEGE